MTRFVPLILLPLVVAAAQPVTGSPPDAVVAEVNGRALAEQDLHASLVLRGFPTEVSPSVRAQAVRRLVDRELVRQFLERRKTEADPGRLAAAVRGVMERLSAQGQEPEAALASLGVDEEQLKSELAVSIAWRHHVDRVLTEQQIAEHFEEHRRRLDGTRLRVSQIFLKYEPGESVADATKTTARLRSIREEIAAGKTTFAEAAKAHSQSPTGDDGGDIGWIRPRGDLPEAVSRATYALEPGEVSEVVLSPFGAHLVAVTEIEPGDLSLEDARPAVIDELSQALWDETVAAERKTAKIVLKTGE